jgi:hypothetical protein
MGPFGLTPPFLVRANVSRHALGPTFHAVIGALRYADHSVVTLYAGPARFRAARRSGR